MATILIVDDLAADRAVMVILLRAHGYRAIEASDGRAALAAVQAEHPDLVITDVLMPVMDGYEFVRRLRLDPATGITPVVFYTAQYAEREARRLAMSSGVSCVLTKPAKSEDVLALVERLLSGEPPSAGLSEAPPLTIEFDREHLQLLTDKLSTQSGGLRKANARLRALINIGLELASERDIGRLLQHVCGATRDLFGATYVTLGILDRHDRTVQRVVMSGIAETAGWFTVGKPIEGILGTVVSERRAFRGDRPPTARGEPPFPAGHPDVRAFLSVPIASPAHVYGWLCLVSTDDRRFNENDEELVKALSGLVGRIYENGYFASIAQKRAADLEREILERQRAESGLREGREALQKAEERMRYALEASGVGIWDQDFTTGTLQWSAILESQYGLAPGTFSGTQDAFIAHIHPDDREAVIDTIAKSTRSGADFTVEHRALWLDGTVRWLRGAGRFHLSAAGEPVRGVGISLDVTEHRTLEDQYQQAQKMEAVGRLAGGVAHDFNNLLTVILGFCGLAIEGLDPADRRFSDISEIQKAGAQGAGLTRQLLAFSRKEIIEPTWLDLNVVLAEMQVMLERLIGEDVKVVLRRLPNLTLIRADRGQIEQVVMNLAINAKDAMPHGGTLTIETAHVELDQHYATTHLAAQPGPHVVLTVTDTGTGIPPAVLAHLFEPFFTTKERGKGTGLGLASVHGIVTRTGGSVNVSSEAGQGTSFNIYFPRTYAGEIVEDAAPRAITPRAGGETVLVVDDAEALRELASRLLRRENYTVLVAANANEARRMFEEHKSIDVILTDVVMPGASGPELTRGLVAQRPGLKVIYMSGYTEEAIVHHGVLNPGVTFLHKPFTAETLGQKVREVLDR